MSPEGSPLYDFSAPWARTSLLNTPTYIASADFISHVQWSKSANQNDLVFVPNDAEATPPKQATCAVVGIVSPNQLFLELHGNYNPTFEKTTLETLKAQFQLVSPTLHPEFKIDFNLGIGHLKTIQRNAIKEGPTAQHFVVSDGLKKALKFSSPLFEKRTFPYDSTDNEDWTNDYPITQKYKDIFEDIVPRWRATPLPAFDTNGHYIKTHELEAALMGSLVLVYFELKHFPIEDKRSAVISNNTFSAVATQVKVLERGSKQ